MANVLLGIHSHPDTVEPVMYDCDIILSTN